MPQTANEPASSAERHYFEQLTQGRFAIPQCQDCARHHFYPRVVCPHCGSDALRWVEPSGRGEVYSTTVVRAKGGDYTVCLVDLEEGPRLMSRVVGMPVDAVHIGQRVRARIDAVDGAPLLVFVAQTEERA
ncbi:DNA-binding protein [Achromobacter denitrificans]|uniref:Zn-ribbon domain-containing OB-fold protein n=1 Tax=Achromobacter denitrificans TaxID=32002 RepID=UPI000B490ABB|nr:OB-fold domain-containing protein [Achromobacter denitrificans]MBV2160591.1 OB-fold domain-containing protein [Achromobacter denitrificans]MDX3877672.1 OB-fold domain-containing protein [Achromobacter sp.]RSE84261.1 DNA-binding protein [Achromobacter denitrificans]WFC69816.1 DNA-binding protein [Achromobacter denitrificans]